MWRKCGATVAQKWCKCGAKVVQMWRKCGANVAQKLRKSGANVDKCIFETYSVKVKLIFTFLSCLNKQNIQVLMKLELYIIFKLFLNVNNVEP